MIIKIDTPTEEPIEKVLMYVEEWLIDNFNEFKLSIDDKLMCEMGKDGKVKRYYKEVNQNAKR